MNVREHRDDFQNLMENGLSISAIMANMYYSVDGEGGNHLAKILAKKCSGKLYEVTKKLHIPVFEEEKPEGAAL